MLCQLYEYQFHYFFAARIGKRNVQNLLLVPYGLHTVMLYAVDDSVQVLKRSQCAIGVATERSQRHEKCGRLLTA